MKIALINAAGQVLSIDPSRPSIIETRVAVGPWEELELVKDGEDFLARWIAADRRVSFTDDGKVEPRPAEADGSWERLQATTQPDGQHFLYRAGRVFTLLRFREVA